MAVREKHKHQHVVPEIYRTAKHVIKASAILFDLYPTGRLKKSVLAPDACSLNPDISQPCSPILVKNKTKDFPSHSSEYCPFKHGNFTLSKTSPPQLTKQYSHLENIVFTYKK